MNEKSIFHIQNDEFILRCLRTQSQMYSKAKKYNIYEAVLTFILPVCAVFINLINILREYSDYINCMAFLFIVITYFIANKSIQMKTQAAMIQQYIDSSLYNRVLMDDKNVFKISDLNKNNIALLIAKYGNDDTDDFRNWYADYSMFPAEMQIFYCQKDNIYWDGWLRKKLYVAIAIGMFLALALLLLISCYYSMYLINLLNICSAIAVFRFIWPVFMKLHKDVSRMDEIGDYIKHIEMQLQNNNVNDLLVELTMLQVKIMEHRKNAVLVPDFIHKIFKSKIQEDIERRIKFNKLMSDFENNQISK
ncbi:S-4TM family putative pore-forming effector [Selenomonas ruminantium]|uniref:Uncharacterized protein n=1 Tax=Selenomonas ruminantium TaxID=971 RepID=A0A1H0NY70_SELRU|nr:S-4TM family putative pore-forming effector [Selenomonas ruminantium]SDO97579.1 hypothetical protein SAMN05216366_10429 [Selenomonas ruminantium]